jgi:tetratricopeptide (TPR) repeat protein
MNRIAIYLLFAIGLTAFPIQGFAESFLVENGQPRAEIIVAEDPPRSTRLAAWELQNYLRKISGAELPIVSRPTVDGNIKLYVGESEFTRKLGITAQGLEFGAYRIVSGKDWLTLIGTDTDFQPFEPYTRSRSERGSEKIVAAWDKITGDHKWGHPAGNEFKMLLRNAEQEFREEKQDDPLDLWAYDERGSFNAVCGFLRDLGVRWYMPGELGEVVPQRASIALPKIDRRVEPAFAVRDCNIRLGIHDRRLAVWGMRLGMRQPHGFGWAHGLNGVTDREEMKREHPEYYALFAGQRATGFRSGGKQCLSSPGLLKETVSYAQTLFDHYNYEVVSAQPADGYTSLCGCELCLGKDSPEGPHRGRMSDYVWDFTVRVAEETARTHPDRMIQNMAYNLAVLPPTAIEKLPDNVLVCMIGARRPTTVDPVLRQEIHDLREAWKKMTDGKLVNFENYPHTARGHWLPSFTPHTIAESVNAIKGDFIGESINPDSHLFMDAVAFNSFQFYFTFRMYWGDKDQDIDPMLEEFYTLFYGPARTPMKAFYEYCEAHWPEMREDKARADQALALFAAARKQVEKGSVYDRRLALLGEYLDGLADRSKQIATEQERKNVPELRMWRDAQQVKLDGRLDDEFWQKTPGWASGRLRELQTGREPMLGTSFKAAWGSDGIYFAVRCEERKGDTVKIGAERDDDPAIWYGDCIEILLENEENSYYQIAISPTGAVVDIDRAQGKTQGFRWDSQAEARTHIGEDYWSVEVRIPVTSDQNDPFHQVIGRKPLRSLPWYFNLCRQRIRENGSEHSAFSPTGAAGFHVPLKFARFYEGPSSDERSPTFDADETVTDFLSQFTAATRLKESREYSEALTAFVALADYEKATGLQQSRALAEAAACARLSGDDEQAMELAVRVPLESIAKTAQMEVLSGQRNWTAIIERFGDEDLASWPFTEIGAAAAARGRAWSGTQAGDKADADWRLALEFTTDSRTQLSLLNSIARNRETVMKDEDLALETYREICASTTNTGSSDYFYGIQGAARILTRRQEFDDALEMLDKIDVATLRGTWAGSMLLTRAATLRAAGKTNEALEAYRAVLTHQSATNGQKSAAEEAIEALIPLRKEL